MFGLLRPSLLFRERQGNHFVVIWQQNNETGNNVTEKTGVDLHNGQ